MFAKAYELRDVVYETNKYFAIRTEKGFDVYKNDISYAIRCAHIGWRGERGRIRSINECNKRERNEQRPSY